MDLVIRHAVFSKISGNLLHLINDPFDLGGIGLDDGCQVAVAFVGPAPPVEGKGRVRLPQLFPDVYPQPFRKEVRQHGQASCPGNIPHVVCGKGHHHQGAGYLRFHFDSQLFTTGKRRAVPPVTLFPGGTRRQGTKIASPQLDGCIHIEITHHRHFQRFACERPANPGLHLIQGQRCKRLIGGKTETAVPARQKPPPGQGQSPLGRVGQLPVLLFEPFLRKLERVFPESRIKQVGIKQFEKQCQLT